MSKYPGEDTNLPKNMLEAIGSVGLSHLVPKDGLSKIIDSPLIASLERPNHFSTANGHMHDEIGTSLNFTTDGEQDRLIFKRPKNILNEKNETPQDTALFGELSPLAKKCLELTSCEVKSEDIRSNADKNNMDCAKRERSEGSELFLNTGANSMSKRSNVECSVTVNSSELTKQYIANLYSLMDRINVNDFEVNMDKFENRINLGENLYVLSEKFLTTLHMTLKNIISIPSSWVQLENDLLIRLLDVLVENIKTSSAYENKELTDMLNRVSHMSCTAIFMILQSGKNDRRFLKEKYLLVPINFIYDDFETVKELAKEGRPVKENLISLQGPISLLPSFLKHRTSMDESLLTKIVYLFCNILMSDEFEVSSNLQEQAYREKLKATSTTILVSLFEKFPEQREIIIEELLSNVEKLPIKRIQKRLRKIDSEIFVTDFTITIMHMLQSINSYESCLSISNSLENEMIEFEESYLKSQQSLEYFANQITETILQRFIENPTKHRHSLENYVQDLIVLLPFPTWSISQYLLSFMMKKLLLIFASRSQQAANLETVCLQTLGNIGASMFDIKCNALPNQRNNIFQLCNYPDFLPQFLASFQKSLDFTALNFNRESSTRFLWHQRLGAFLSLWGYMKEETEENKKIVALIRNEVVNNLESSKGTNSKKIGNYVEVQHDYCSILHALELLNLYDPYLKAILSLLESEKIKIKSTAIKCLSMLANKDHHILSSPMVKKTIQNALLDSSASVKDAILDLVSIGSACLDFYRQININYDHESVAVRKHVLKINRMIYDKSNEREVKIFVASKILLKIEDEEDTIIDISKQILLERWIISIVEERNLEVQVEICKDIISVMSGVSNADEKTSQHFEWFLNFFLLNKSMHSPERYSDVIKCLNQLTNVLVQYITELYGTEANTKDQQDRCRDALNLLAKFSDGCDSFITKDHVVALYPYLLSDSSSDLSYYILLVFKNTFEKLGVFKPKFLYDLETTLLRKLPRMNVKEIDEAMPLVWQISNQRNDTARVTRACSSCFQHLSPYIKQANTSAEIPVEGKLQRLLYLATGFARFCNFGGKDQKPQYVNEDESVHAYVAKCLLVLSREKIPHIIRRIAIKNLSQLCCAHPKLFNSKIILELLDKELKDGQMDVKLVILESLYDFFSLEEKKSIRKTGVRSSVSSSKALKAKVLHERKTETVNDGICSALVIRFLKSILKICLSEDIKSSLVAVRLLKLVLQHGYTNPSHCIPTVIALVGSTNSYMSFIATEILKELFQRYETMVFSGISQGLKVSLEYSKTQEKNGFYKNNIVLNKLKNIVGSSRKNTSKYYRSVLRVLKISFDSVVGARCDIETKDCIIFLASNISTFDFNTQNELMLFLKEMDLTSEQFQEAIADSLSQSGEKNIDGDLVNTVVIQKCLRGLSSYLIQLYGINPDLMTNLKEDSELKNRQLTTQNTKLSFMPILDQIVHDSNSQRYFVEYIDQEMK